MSRAAKLKARAAAGDRDAAQLTATAAALEAAGLEPRSSFSWPQRSEDNYNKASILGIVVVDSFQERTSISEPVKLTPLQLFLICCLVQRPL